MQNPGEYVLMRVTVYAPFIIENFMTNYSCTYYCIGIPLASLTEVVVGYRKLEPEESGKINTSVTISLFYGIPTSVTILSHNCQ